MTLVAYRGVCPTCGHDHDKFNNLLMGESSARPAGYVAEPAVRRRGGKTLLIIGGVEYVITTEQALDLAENLKSAAFLAGDY